MLSSFHGTALQGEVELRPGDRGQNTRGLVYWPLEFGLFPEGGVNIEGF